MGYFLVSGRAIIRERKDEGSSKPKRNEDRLATEEWRKSPDLRDNKNHLISATIQTTQEQQWEPQSRSGKDLTASGSKRPSRWVNSLQDNPRNREDLQLSRSSGCSLTHFTTPFLSHWLTSSSCSAGRWRDNISFKTIHELVYIYNHSRQSLSNKINIHWAITK